jgi:hypothetical protein
MVAPTLSFVKPANAAQPPAINNINLLFGFKTINPAAASNAIISWGCAGSKPSFSKCNITSSIPEMPNGGLPVILHTKIPLNNEMLNQVITVFRRTTS